MQYMAENFADYGFSFLEKLHSPIFLISKFGVVKRINEAGRKLVSVAHLTPPQMDELAKSVVIKTKGAKRVTLQHFTCKNKQLRLIANQLGNSEYFLVELMR